MGAYNILLVLGTILTIIFIVILIVSDGKLNDSQFGAIFLTALVAMACWGGFFYGVGVKEGANEVAKGHYKTYYLYDKDGNVTDTIAEFPH